MLCDFVAFILPHFSHPLHRGLCTAFFNCLCCIPPAASCHSGRDTADLLAWRLETPGHSVLVGFLNGMLCERWQESLAAASRTAHGVNLSRHRSVGISDIIKMELYKAWLTDLVMYHIDCFWYEKMEGLQCLKAHVIFSIA